MHATAWRSSMRVVCSHRERAEWSLGCINVLYALFVKKQMNTEIREAVGVMMSGDGA